MILEIATYAKSGNYATIAGLFTGASSVAVTVKDFSDGSTVSLTTGAASQVGSTGVWKWSTSDIVTQPSTFKEYLVTMTPNDGAENKDILLKTGGVRDTIYDIKTYLSALVANLAGSMTVAMSNTLGTFGAATAGAVGVLSTSIGNVSAMIAGLGLSARLDTLSVGVGGVGTAVGAIDTAVGNVASAIAALNNLSQSQAQDAAAAAITAADLADVSDVAAAVTAINNTTTGLIAALHNLSSADAEAACTAALTAFGVSTLTLEQLAAGVSVDITLTGGAGGSVTFTEPVNVVVTPDTVNVTVTIPD